MPRPPQAAPDMLDVSNEEQLDPAVDEDDFQQPAEPMACTSCQEEGGHGCQVLCLVYRPDVYRVCVCSL